MTQPDFEALFLSAYRAWHGDETGKPRQAAAQVLREAFEAQLAEVQAEGERNTLQAIEIIGKRDHTITTLQAREAEHLATIARLREAVLDLAANITDWDGVASHSEIMIDQARTALNGESDRG